MKIIYLIAGTYRPAGMERVLSLKAAYLARRGHEILIVTTDQRGQKSVFDLGNFRQRDLGINYELTNGAPFWKKTLLYFVKHKIHRRMLRRVLEEEKADIVVSMFNNDVDIVPYINDGSRKVLEVHFSRFKKIQYARKGLWALADRWRTYSEVRAAAKFDRFVTLTEEDRTYWEADYSAAGLKSNIEAIPNPGSFTGVAAPFAGRAGNTVLAVGRYTYQKGFDMLLDAWKKIKENPVAAEWKLRIAGDGEDRDALESRALRLGVADSVEFGPCADMKELYSHADIVVMTSRFEGFGMVLVEAQSCGVPAVAFACKCGPSEIIADGEDGYLVEPGDVDALAGRTLALMGDSSLREAMGAAACRNSERFDISRIMPRWEKLFGELKDGDGK